MDISLNLYLRSGDTFAQTWTISQPDPSDPAGQTPGTPVDLTGCSAEMVIESLYSVAPVYTLNSGQATANGGTLTLGGTAGTVLINIPPTDTDLLANGMYALRITFADGSVQTFAEGSVFLDREAQSWQ
jgi:hypothetical protein